ncbi:MAG: patatin-like phospholipase family protein, partial [Dehalococcoidia bacterium]
VTPGELLDWLLRGLRIAPDAGPLGRRLWQAYGRLTFAELALPFAAVALDLISGERLLLREGRVGPAVEASIRPPLLLPPAIVDGRRMVDGGLQRALPVEAAYDLGASVVIGVRIGPRLSLPPALRPLSALVGEAFLRRRPDADSIERQVGFMARLLAGGYQAGRAPDILIKPNLVGISAVSPFQLRLAMRRGEAAARVALPRIRSLLAERSAQAGRSP